MSNDFQPFTLLAVITIIRVHFNMINMCYGIILFCSVCMYFCSVCCVYSAKTRPLYSVQSLVFCSLCIVTNIRVDYGSGLCSVCGIASLWYCLL